MAVDERLASHRLRWCPAEWVRPLLTPASVAVIGASRRRGSVGRVILQNIIGGGFSGPVYAADRVRPPARDRECPQTPAHPR